MNVEGNIIKMRTIHTDPIQYFLKVGENEVEMNNLIGRNISMTWGKRINCKICGRRTKKSFGQGFCYPCFISASEAEECVLRPELCRAHEGIARNMEYAKEHCLIDHIVYLAITNELKVGVTRISQVPTRWIDQGAVKVITLAKTPNRYLAGLIEVELKKYMADKTNWRNMLTNKIETTIDLNNEKNKASNFLPESLKRYKSDIEMISEFSYPVTEYPSKVQSFDFDKESVLRGIFQGIKGQYLIFKNGVVVNIRKYEGYYMRLDV